MAIADFNKIRAFSELAEALSLELCFGYKTNIPVDFKTLDYYKNNFDDAMAKKTCLVGDFANSSAGAVYLAKRYFNTIDFDLSDFPKKIFKYYDPLKENYDNLINGKWRRE